MGAADGRGDEVETHSARGRFYSNLNTPVIGGQRQSALPCAKSTDGVRCQDKRRFQVSVFRCQGYSIWDCGLRPVGVIEAYAPEGFRISDLRYSVDLIVNYRIGSGNAN